MYLGYSARFDGMPSQGHKVTSNLSTANRNTAIKTVTAK